MIDLQKPFDVKLSNETSQLLEQVDEEKGRFDQLRPLDRDTQQRIKMAFLPDRVTASLNMEGIVATRRQTLAIMDSMAIDENSSKTEQEILNALRADELVLDAVGESAKLTESLVREINSLIQDGFEAGLPGYRRIQVTISEANFTPPGPMEIAGLMRELVDSYNDSATVHPIIRASWLHARFTYIHPFIDGNGRTGRLLQDFALLQGEMFPTGIPSVERDNYYDALSNADNNEWNPLVQILALRQLDVTAKAYGIANERRERSSWIQSLARRAKDKKVGTQHKRYLVWAHKMAAFRSTFEDTAAELSESSDLIQINHENFDLIPFEKWCEVANTGRATRTWLFAQTFYVDHQKVYRCIFYFRRHIPLTSDTFERAEDGVCLIVSGGSGDQALNLFNRYEDSSVRLREILLLGEHTLTYYANMTDQIDPSRTEYWEPTGPETASEIVQDFYEDILAKRVGI